MAYDNDCPAAPYYETIEETVIRVEELPETKLCKALAELDAENRRWLAELRELRGLL